MYTAQHSSATNVWAIGRTMQYLMEMDGREREDILFDGREFYLGDGPEPDFPISPRVVPCYGQELVDLAKACTRARPVDRIPMDELWREIRSHVEGFQWRKTVPMEYQKLPEGEIVRYKADVSERFVR